MHPYIFGLLTIPALAVVFVVVYVIGIAAFRVKDEFLTHNPKFGHRVYAYRVTATTGNTDLIGAVFTERRNLGPEHTYLISWDGMRNATAWAKRLPGGGVYRSGHDIDWDDETLVTMDDYIEYRDHVAPGPAAEVLAAAAAKANGS
jgi:hypothetical protein